MDIEKDLHRSLPEMAPYQSEVSRSRVPSTIMLTPDPKTKDWAVRASPRADGVCVAQPDGRLLPIDEHYRERAPSLCPRGRRLLAARRALRAAPPRVLYKDDGRRRHRPARL